MSIGFESMEEAKDTIQEVPAATEQVGAGELPPRLERDGEAGDAGETTEKPPKLGREGGLGTLGETVEHRGARHGLESAIRDGNKIAVENRLKDLAKIEAKEAAKKLQR